MIVLLLGKNNNIIEDILWDTEVKAYHIGNKTDFSRPFSDSRIICPWTFKRLEGTITSDALDLKKARSATIEKLYPEGKPDGSLYIDQFSDPWVKYLTMLHTWANYKVWLARCSGSRDMGKIIQSVSKDPSSKLYYNKNNGKEKFPTNLFNTGIKWNYKEENLKTYKIAKNANLSELLEAKEQGHDLSATVQVEQTTEGAFYVVKENVHNLQKESGRYATIKTFINLKICKNILSFGVIDEQPKHITPAKVKHLQLLTWNSGINDNFPWSKVETSQERIKKDKQKKKEIKAQELKKLDLQKPTIWETIINKKGWNQAENIYNKDKFDDNTWYPGKGNPEADTWIIGLYPTTAEREGAIKDPKTGVRKYTQPTILLGAAGEELNHQIKLAGLDPNSDVYIDNVLRKYKPPKSTASAEDKLEQAWLLKALICHYKPKKIICLGADVLKVFMGGKIKFSEHRGSWLNATVTIDQKLASRLKIDTISHDLEINATYHPTFALRPENRHTMGALREDMKLILSGQRAEDKSKNLPKIKVKEIRNAKELQEFYLAVKLTAIQKGYNYRLGIDTESYTIGDYRLDKLVSIQIGVRYIDQFGMPVKDGPIDVATIIYREKPNPEYFSYKDYLQNRQEIQEFSFFNTSDEVIAKSTKSIALYDPKDTYKINEIQMKFKCNLHVFKYYNTKIHIKENCVEMAKLLNALFFGDECIELVMTNTNHDRARLHHMCDVNFDLLKKPIADTIIGEHIINEANNERGLKASVKRWLDWNNYEANLNQYRDKYKLNDICKYAPEGIPKSYWILFPWSVIKNYAALDAVGTLLVREKHIEEMNKQVLELQGGRDQNNIHDAFRISCEALNGIYEMQIMGMPVGEKGFKNLKALEDFYDHEEKKAVKSFKEKIFELTGIKNCSPTSSDQIAYALFGESSPLPRVGMRPWKESGKEGRLWDDIPYSEQKTANPAVDAESLEILASNCPDKDLQQVLMQISETKTIITIRNNFIVTQEQANKGKGLKGKISPASQNLHTTYMPVLDTARCRSVPNLSTLPGREMYTVEKITGNTPPCAIRDIVQAPDGYFLLSRDWDTAEVLQLAYLSQDPNMMKIIYEMKNGQDFHAIIAMKAFPQIHTILDLWEHSPHFDEKIIGKIINGKKRIKIAKKLWKERWDKFSLENKPKPLTLGQKCIFVKEAMSDLRSNAKPVTFGVPYGRTGTQICKQLNREYYVNDVKDENGILLSISEEECDAMVNGYKEEFAVAWAYLVNQAEQAKTNSYLQDSWGYIRHFPKAMPADQKMRKAYNYQIQHGVAVLMNQAMNQWTQDRKARNLKSYAYYTLYDAIGWVVHESEVQEVWDLSLRCMCYDRPVAPNGLANNWKITVDGELKYGLSSGSVDTSALNLKERPEWNNNGLTKEQLNTIQAKYNN